MSNWNQVNVHMQLHKSDNKINVLPLITSLSVGKPREKGIRSLFTRFKPHAKQIPNSSYKFHVQTAITTNQMNMRDYYIEVIRM